MTKLSGMTGFARVSGEAEWGSWAWEAKSVNGRGLDVRVNTPPGFDGLERGLKAGAAKRFKRGNMQISLRIEMAEAAGAITVNQAAFDTLLRHLEDRTLGDASPEAMATLYNIKGVVETGSGSVRDLATDEAVLNDMAKGGERVLDALATSRTEEGAALEEIMTRLVSEMEAVTTEAETLAAGHPALIKKRLKRQLAELDAESKVESDRLAAEVALQAAKADVREELDRLRAHFVSARDHLSEGSPIGRKLDFLAQELNREANTLCSKSASSDLTNAGLSLKGLIDQFKEQAANVE